MLLYPVVIVSLSFEWKHCSFFGHQNTKKCLEDVDSCQAIHKSTILGGVPEAFFSEMGHVVADVFLSVSQSVL